MNFSALILAAGASTRMGRDKAWLSVGGKPLLARQIELVQALGANEILISGRTDTDYSALGGRVVVDRFLHAGPLAGIESGLAATNAPLLLVLAVDMPEMTADFLRALGADCTAHCGAVPQLVSRLEPLAAFYPKQALPLAREMLLQPQAGEPDRSPGPTDFARRCAREGFVRIFPVAATDARHFANLNSPEDLRANNPSML